MARQTNCPYNHPECSGISGLYFGRLACWSCYLDAPQNARDLHTVWTADGQHPALAEAPA